MQFMILSVVFGVVQIMLWNALPFKKYLIQLPTCCIAANFLGSMAIFTIAGSSALIGGANLTGSVIFAIYVLILREISK